MMNNASKTYPTISIRILSHCNFKKYKNLKKIFKDGI